MPKQYTPAQLARFIAENLEENNERVAEVTWQISPGEELMLVTDTDGNEFLVSVQAVEE